MIARLPGEPDPALAALEAHAAHPAPRPSFRALARELGIPHVTTITRWAARWKWAERLEALDAAGPPSPPRPAATPPPGPAPATVHPAGPPEASALMRALADLACDPDERASVRLQAAEKSLALMGIMAPRRPAFGQAESAREAEEEARRQAAAARLSRMTTPALLAAHLIFGARHPGCPRPESEGCPNADTPAEACPFAPRCLVLFAAASVAFLRAYVDGSARLFSAPGEPSCFWNPTHPAGGYGTTPDADETEASYLAKAPGEDEAAAADRAALYRLATG